MKPLPPGGISIDPLLPPPDARARSKYCGSSPADPGRPCCCCCERSTEPVPRPAPEPDMALILLPESTRERPGRPMPMGIPMPPEDETEETSCCGCHPPVPDAAAADGDIRPDVSLPLPAPPNIPWESEETDNLLPCPEALLLLPPPPPLMLPAEVLVEGKASAAEAGLSELPPLKRRFMAAVSLLEGCCSYQDDTSSAVPYAGGGVV